MATVLDPVERDDAAAGRSDVTPPPATSVLTRLARAVTRAAGFAYALLRSALGR